MIAILDDRWHPLITFNPSCLTPASTMIALKLRSSAGQIRVRFQLPKVVIIIVSHPWPSVIFFTHPFFAAIDTKRYSVGIEQSIIPFTTQVRPFLLSTPPQCYKNDDVALQISYTRVQTSIGLPAISYLFESTGSEQSSKGRSFHLIPHKTTSARLEG